MSGSFASTSPKSDTGETRGSRVPRTRKDNKVIGRAIIMTSEDDTVRVYVLVEVQPGREKEFMDEVLSRGLVRDSRVERMDFVHGSFDLVVVLIGAMKDVDSRVIAMRRIPFVLRTETLISFGMLNWEHMSGRLNK